MDWSKVKSAIGTIAPWIAGTLGSPVAGVGVKVLCDALGMGTQATPEATMAALAGASPDQLLALKQADLAHQEMMVKLGYDSLDKLEATAAGDRASARQMQIATPSMWPGILSAVVTVGFFATVGAMMAGIDPTDNQAFLIMLGSLGTGWTTVLAFWFGTTKSSNDKNALLAQSAPAK